MSPMSGGTLNHQRKTTLLLPIVGLVKRVEQTERERQRERQRERERDRERERQKEIETEIYRQ
jgi:hypothetical protein